MKLKIVSDLHLEFSDIIIQNNNDYDLLILSGDIMIAEDLHNYPEEKIQAAVMIDSLSRRQEIVQRFRNFLKNCSMEFPNVIYIAGNHEFYHGKWISAINYLREECSKYSNIHFLEMDTWEYENYVFIGGTLWTDMNKMDPITLHAISGLMNDYQIIRHDESGFRKLKPADTVHRHQKTLSYIKSVIRNDPTKKYVVVGHHAPSKLSTHAKYAGDFVGNGAYSSDLSDFILDHPEIKLWTHGHTHHPFDYMIGSTRIVCNPRGYEGYEPDSGWNPDIVIEI